MVPCSGYETFGQYLESHSAIEAMSCMFQKAPVAPSAMAQSLWLIIALPILGAIIAGLFGRSLGRANTGFIASSAVGGSFILSALTAWVLNDHGLLTPNPFSPTTSTYSIAHDFGTWFSSGAFQVHLGLRADHLSGSMLLVITGVGLLIHIYSTSYMSHDEGYWRYFAYLNLFVAMMLTLVLADNLILLFVGWEGVGLCSYLLIGFWYTDSEKAFAGRKAFVVNRIGDFGFLLGVFVLVMVVEAFNAQLSNTAFTGRGAHSATAVAQKWRDGLSTVGALNFQGLEEMARAIGSSLDVAINHGPLKGFTFGQTLTAVLLLFLLGASGKSAQLPLYVWLPDAMAGPTPVSALIHAATMVTAGVYLFCRVSYLVVLSPTAMAVTAIIGACTALLAALIAFSQNDIKKVLAYSTVSQLGLMFLGVGVGAFWAAFLHVVTHAFFKACLFLGAGSVMHGNGDETDIRKLGGLRREMKWTWATFLVSTLAITGIVPLSGFFSKDAILHAAHTSSIKGFEHVPHLVYWLGLTVAGCTAFYMMRLYVMTFEGERSREARLPHAHESDEAMTVPLVVLATLAVLFAYHGFPLHFEGAGLQTMMENYLSPVFNTTNRLIADQPRFLTVEHEAERPWGAWGIAWAVALTGGGLAYYLYTSVFPKLAGRSLPAPIRVLRRVTEHKFFVDELYDFVIVRPLKLVALVLFKVVDAILIDTVAVRGTGWITTRLGAGLRYLQTGDAQSYAAVMAVALLGGIAYALVRVLS